VGGVRPGLAAPPPSGCNPGGGTVIPPCPRRWKRCRGPIALSLAARPDVAHQPRPRGAPHLIFFIVFPPGRLPTSRAHPLLRRAHDAPLRADGPGGDPARTFAYRTHCRIPNICRTLQHSSQIPADALLVAEGRKTVHYAA